MGRNMEICQPDRGSVKVLMSSLDSKDIPFPPGFVVMCSRESNAHAAEARSILARLSLGEDGTLYVLYA
jgi:hypothetical protein